MAALAHITNGDSVAAALHESGVGGTVLPWRDVLSEGPLPAADDEGFAEIRARYLASAGYDDLDTVRQGMGRQFLQLRQACEALELVLWFEHDLHDQVQLVFLLSWLGWHPTRPAVLSLICIDRFPGIEPFHGLGDLRPAQLAGLFPRRTPVSAEMADLAKEAWNAFTAPTPEPLNDLLSRPTPALPFLSAAIHRYLEEYPATGTGLSRTEGTILEELATGPLSAPGLFHAVMRREEAVFMGDTSFWRILRGLARFPVPLVTLAGHVETGDPSLPDVEVAHTAAGAAVLSGARDWVELAGIDRWHGGVHLAGRMIRWRWDPDRHRVVPLPGGPAGT